MQYTELTQSQHPKVRQWLHRPKRVGAAVFVLSLGIMAWVVWQIHHRALWTEQLRHAEQVSSHVTSIQVSMERALSAAYAIGAVVRQGNGQVADFEGLTQALLPSYPGVSSIALAPLGVVNQVAPRAGNERALGLDLLNDPVQGPDARRAKTSRALTVAGPVKLVQGGIGIVGRLPVSIPRDGSSDFWGLISVVVRMPDALANAHLEQLQTAGLAYQLSIRDPQTQTPTALASFRPDRLIEPMQREFTVSNSLWTISVAPLHAGSADQNLVWHGLLAVAASLLLAYCAKLLLQLGIHRVGQDALIDARTRDLSASTAKLQATLDAIPDLILEVGLDGVFYEYRPPRNTQNYPPSEFFLGQNAVSIMPAEAALALLTALREAHQTGHSDGQQIFLDCQHGRQWFDISVTPKHERTADEPILIVLARDITQRKQAETELRVAATAFESQLGMAITDANEKILRINHAFTTITGFTDQDAVGNTLHFLDSSRHDAEFFQEMLTTVRKTSAWTGEIWNKRKSGEVFPCQCTMSAVRAEDGTITHYINSFTDITQIKQTQDEINKLAFYDPLTDLPNRRMLLDRLRLAMAQSNRTAQIGALQFMDLDNFKTLNDTLGHDMGDLLLQQVGQRLKDCVREGDTVARLGGDEFVVMLKDLSENLVDAATQAEIVAHKILNRIGEPYRLAGLDYRITPSIGITHFRGFEASIDDLLKQADLAMYQAKALGRNAVQFYDPSMQSVVTARVELEADIRQGLLQSQFLLYFQPQISAKGQCTGAEVLLRWPHPTRGMVPPNEFISLAEDTGQILPIGAWVLETACQQLVKWARQPETEHLTLAVNVSARQFRQQDFVSFVSDLIQYTGVNPKRLKLELTESMLVKDVEDTIGKMNRLKAYGIGFSLDDFGTGYSSLSYLKRLPLDQLKIDQSFVRDLMTDPNDAAIARAVVTLGHSLGLTVIAEGVETDEQRGFLAEQGCDAYQGYLFGRPLPIAEFERHVNVT